MPFTIGEYQDIFLQEADEQLQELNHSLLDLEKNPDNIEIETINSIFRTAHSLKSSAAFVGLNDLSDLAHHMENLLQGVRDKTMVMTSEIIEILFKCFDIISSIINSVARGEEPDQNISGILDKIKKISTKSKIAFPKAKEAENVKINIKKKESVKKESPKVKYTQDEMKMIVDGLKAGKSCYELDISIDPAAQMRWIKAQLLVTNLEKINDIITTIPSMDDISKEWESDVFRIILFSDQTIEKIKESCTIDQVNKVDLVKIDISIKNEKTSLKIHNKKTIFEESFEQIKSSGKDQKEKGAAEIEKAADSETDLYEEERDEIVFGRRKEDKRSVSLKIVKVSVDKLDLLLNTVGELVIANSGFFRLFDEIKKSNIDKSIISEFKNKMDEMSRIAKDLQSRIMKTRMVPIGQVLSRFNRPVRDLAKEFNKKINFVIKGEETELDKKVIDVIGEPLLHLLRNAIDHGVETPEERKRLGKPEEAMVTINAYQGGNQIFVEVGDDGRGLNIEKIKNIAVSKGLIKSEMLEHMDDDDVIDFIFRPGFSTADIVTDVSGRGVGMNVVKETVNELNGSIRIETEPGMGTNFVLSFSLTLAIIPAIMVKVNNERYSIPLPDVIETIKIYQSDITTIEGREVINLRGEILSLLRLNEFIGIKSSLAADQKIPVVIVGYGNRKIGVIIDELEGKQEIVIKSLDENYTNIEGLAGASILGDGSICLILDISSMINKVISDEERAFKHRKSVGSDEREGEDFVVKEISREPETESKTIIFDQPIKRDVESSAKLGQVTKKDEKITPAISEEENEIAEDIIFFKKEEKNKERLNKSLITEDHIQQRVKESLSTFKKELEENISSNIDINYDNQLINTLEIKKEEIEKINVIANVGIANAAESLSKILDKTVSLSIPEVEIIPLKNIAKTIGGIDTVYVGVFMPLMGDISGAVLFSFTEESGFELIDMLYGLSTGKTKILDQDGESALKEVTNIIGSSMINVLAEKIDLVIRPDIPTIIHDYIQSTVDSILIQNNIAGEYALSMNTYFYYHDDRVLGKLLIISDTDSLKKMIEKLK